MGRPTRLFVPRAPLAGSGSPANITVQWKTLHVWLVEYNHAFLLLRPEDREPTKQRVLELTRDWVGAVLERYRRATLAQSPHATVPPQRAWISWLPQFSNTFAPTADQHLIIYFSPGPYLYGAPPAGINLAERTLLEGDFKRALDELNAKAVGLRMPNVHGDIDWNAGGMTFWSPVGESETEVMCEAWVGKFLSDHPDPTRRVEANARMLVQRSFHEAVHNKARIGDDVLGAQNPGGVLGPEAYESAPYSDYHKLPTPHDIAFMARYIWNWSPQFVLGRSLNWYSRP